MNPFRVSHKSQAISPQNSYISNQSCGVCLQNTYDYSPFGVSLDERTVESDFYRRGYNGMEKDDEFKGKGNSYDFGARMYDNRVGRWFILDPEKIKYPMHSPYIFCLNNPIYYIDLIGKDVIPTKNFISSRYFEYYSKLRESSPTFNEILKPYMDSPTLNLLLDVNDTEVKENGNFAFTRGPNKTFNTYTNGPNKGKYIPNSLRLTSPTIEFFSNENIRTKQKETTSPLGELYTYNVTITDITIVASIIHESLHAYVKFEQKNLIKTIDTKSGGHTELNEHRNLFIKVLTEYSDFNNLNWSTLNIDDLSWHGTEQSKQFISHFTDLAFNKGTTYQEEVGEWKTRVSKLTTKVTDTVKE
jgi:RHS repeat-associated protein